jgi:predicted amidohydrolase YtcJ
MDVDTLDVTLAALESDRPPPGTTDRIEHNALCLPEQIDRIAAVGATVVVNPAFLLHRAAKYRRELTPVEQSWLVRIRSLLDAGISVLAGSDSPVVPADPAETIAAATAHPFTPAESVSLETATRMCQKQSA